MRAAPQDTSASAHEVQHGVWRMLGGARRLALALSMSDDVREVAAAGIRRRHPDYAPSDVMWALKRLLLGDALFSRAYPSRPLLQP